MFGEKAQKIDAQAQRIAELEQKLADADVKAHPQLVLARQIEADVQNQIINDPTMDINKTMSMAIERAGQTAVAQILITKIESLTVNELLRAYAECTNDDSVLDVLTRRALIKHRQLERRTLIEDMRNDALLSRKLDLTKLPVGSVVEIGLFYKEHKDRQSYEHSDLATRRIVGRVDDTTAPNQLTILEYYDQYDNKSTLFAENAIVEFGSVIANKKGGQDFIPQFTHGVVPAYRPLGKVRLEGPFYYDVGYVKVDEDVVLDSPDVMKAQIAAEQPT
jgi:hypothetical protein